MMRRLFRVGIVVVASGLGVNVWAASGPQTVSDSALTPRLEPAYLGGFVTPPLPKPNFTLIDTSGAPFDFWSRTQGYVTLLFFGYAHCPDQCPLHLENIAIALKKMPSGLDDHVKLVFVTTDPVRDTPQGLRSWLDRFYRRFLALTGGEPSTRAAQP